MPKEAKVPKEPEDPKVAKESKEPEEPKDPEVFGGNGGDQWMALERNSWMTLFWTRDSLTGLEHGFR